MGSMRTPDEIALALAEKTVTDRNMGRWGVWITKAEARGLAEQAAREATAGTLVVSTRDGRVRTGVVNRTVTDLAEVILGYIADGYNYDELVIEGITE